MFVWVAMMGRYGWFGPPQPSSPFSLRGRTSQACCELVIMPGGCLLLLINELRKLLPTEPMRV
jgi:hypothetical protein